MQPEALNNPLVGGHLIEASAGTGKTWTLTGVLLRLLIERQIKPERIIATTFTKKAAAEMQERMRQRLLDFYDACVWCKQNQLSLNTIASNEREDHLQKKSEQVSALADPINQHLLLWLLDRPANELDITLYRVQTLLASLHQLYIGTLDSFAHKLLKEYSTITGDAHQKDIASDEQMTVAVKALIQERLRYNHAELKNKPLYPLINQKILGDVALMYKNIKNALHFFGAVIDEVLMPDTQRLDDVIQTIKHSTYEDFGPYYDQAYCEQMGLKKTSLIYKQIATLPILIDAIKSYGAAAFADFTDDNLKLIMALSDDNLAKAFKKSSQEQAHQLKNQSGGRLERLAVAYELYQNILNQFSAWLLYDVATYVRAKLPQTLADEGATTHTLKMHELLKALQGRQGERLARQIYHQYPVALIDEVQDINGEQAALIKALYLKNAHLAHLKNKGFLLLVGDPKQAIYRFRGGDVANYLQLRADMQQLGLATEATLTVNRRSNQALIDGLNAWFDKDYDQLGEGISYQNIHALKKGLGLCSDEAVAGYLPITLMVAGEQVHLKLAWHIHILLQSKTSLDDGEQRRAITPSDIAILVSNNDDIAPLSDALKRYGINSSSSQTVSVFGGRASRDLYHLLLAAYSPTDTNKIGVLTGVFFYDLQEAQAILADQKRQSVLTFFLQKLNRLWQKNGLLDALTDAFGVPIALCGDVTLWQYWARFVDGERYLADMWQLYELVGIWRMPEPLLLEHFVRQMNTACDRYQRIALPAEQAVTITTIHKSKGLEFNVVYVLGMDKKEMGAAKGLVAYVCQASGERRLCSLGQEATAKQEAMAEYKRLGYVALTRAAQKLYVIGQHHTKNSVLREWGFFTKEDDDKSAKNTLTIPSRLTHHLDKLILPDPILPAAAKQPANNQSDIVTDTWGDVMPTTHFLPDQNTSFSAISRLLVTPFGAGQDDEPFAEMGAEDNIRQRFMRGITAGTFLHYVLQHMNGSNTRKTLETGAKKLGLLFDEDTFAELTDWLDEVGGCPFMASGVPLYALQEKTTELPFSLGIAGDFRVADVVALCERFGITLGTAPPQKETIYYLNGEIDLVYEYQGRYHLVDYKSNRLNRYDIATMHRAMDEHGYWLQALIYQVALHRLLAMKFADYKGREQSYLGAVEYVFLRGVDGSGAGQLVWQVPFELVLAMDDLLGPP